MKVLVSPAAADSPSASDVLTTDWKTLRPVGVSIGASDKPQILEGVVVDMPEAVAQTSARDFDISVEDAAQSEYVVEEVKALKSFSRSMRGCSVGDVVRVEPTKSGSSFNIHLPHMEAAKAEAAATEFAVGDAVAFNSFCSPQYMLNCRGTVTEVKGAKLVVRLDAGDLERLKAAGKSKAAKSIRCPKTIVDKVS